MTDFTTVRVVGSALPADVLTHAVTGRELPGLSGDDYGLELHVTPREAANRAWSVLTGAWHGFREAVERLSAEETATALTRSKWLLIVLRELGFGVVGPTPAGGLTADDRSFAISHEAQGDIPLHLLGWSVELDRRTKGLAGAAERAPHVLVQEYLNRSPDALWGIVSNGRLLRLLRDSSTIVGQSYVEFDLEAMFDGEVFSDFVALYLTCHATRFATRDDELGPASCWLEQWRTFAAEAGTRALHGLRDGVARAIEALGSGFLEHPTNDKLRAALGNPGGTITAADLHQSLLRLVYRLLFCFVAEDRGLLLDPDADTTVRERYDRWFSTARLRRIARRRRGTRHHDLWEGLSVVLDGLGRDEGRPELGLRGLGGLFDVGPADVTAGCALANDALLSAIQNLSVVQPPGGGPRRAVDYRNLGAEELGGVYESLLELVPRVDLDRRHFSLDTVAGNERRTSGSYYTPTSLIDCVLDSALDALLDAAERTPDPQAALLDLTVCDPACGSGHFLVAAAKRIAARLALLRAGGAQPSVVDEQEAMAEVVACCIYGVDLNPLAAELAKVSLWLESMQPGRALSFLDAHIKVGNALLGTTPALLAAGIPDAAFTALDGDDKPVVKSLKKRNAAERDTGTAELFTTETINVGTGELRTELEAIALKPATSLADVHLAEQRFRQFDRSPELRHRRLVADAWCAAFVARKHHDAPAITHGVLRRFDESPTNNDAAAKLVAEISAEYRFFHWHLEFPQIFHVDGATAVTMPTGWTGGFSCVVGNPPWERIKLQEQEFFAARDPDIAAAPNAAARKRLIAALADAHPALHAEFLAAKRRADGESQFLRLSGRYPLCGRGDINTYAVFAEHDRTITGEHGRMGVVVPTGIATDATTQHFFKELVNRRALVSLYDFENRQSLFEAVDSRMKFCVLTVGGRDAGVDRAEFAFFLHHPDELANEGRRFELTPGQLTRLNPNTGTCPVFRTRRDAEITLRTYERWPILIGDADRDADGNPWGVTFATRLWHMAEDAEWFRNRSDLEAEGWVLEGNAFTRDKGRMLPLYVGLMASFYDHRAADVVRSDTAVQRQNQPSYLDDAAKADPLRCALPAYWVPEAEVDQRLASFWSRPWLIGFMDITSSTNWRTMVCSPLPRTAVGHSMPLLFPSCSPHLLVAVFSSFCFDFVARQKVGGNHMTLFALEQIPVPPPAAMTESCSWSSESSARWITSRVLELTYTAWDMEPFARDLGDAGPPFRWDPERRAQLRAELDACFFHLYGLDRDDTAYVLSTFPIANRNDPLLTRRVLAAYDALGAATSDTPFTSPLDPPPGSGSRHPAFRA